MGAGMGAKSKKDKQDFETWLLNFERQAGRPVVVSLLIEEEEISFVACFRKKVYEEMQDDDEPEEYSRINLKDLKPKINARLNKINVSDYIG